MTKLNPKRIAVAEPLDRIEQLRCALLTGLMRRDFRIWRSRTLAGERAIDPREVVRPWNDGPPSRFPHDGGYDLDFVDCGGRA